MRVEAAPLLERRFRVMGTTAHVVLCGGSVDLLDDVEAALALAERRWSRFRATSELSRLNAAGGRLTVVSAETFALVARAVEAWAATDGAFDPTVHDALCALGYDRDFPTIGTPDGFGDGPIVGRPAPGCAGIELLADCRGVRLPVGVRLDLGGIAKGHAADLAVAHLLARGVEGACVNIGGDVRVEGRAPGGHPWVVALDAGQGPDRRLALAAGGVCTSSNRRRAWCAGSHRVHHLIDPRTGRSGAAGLSVVSVIARAAAQAEVLTKAVFVRGAVQGRQLLESLDVAGVLVTDDDEVIEVGNVREFHA